MNHIHNLYLKLQCARFSLIQCARDVQYFELPPACILKCVAHLQITEEKTNIAKLYDSHRYLKFV